MGKTRKSGAQFSSAILSTCLALMAVLASIVPAYGDDPIANSPAEQPSVSTDELLRQIQQLRQELGQLRSNQRPPNWFSPDADLRGFSSPASPPPQNDGVMSPISSDSGSSDGVMREDVADPAAGLPGGEGPAIPGIGDNFPMRLSYRYNAGGGYTSLSTPDGKFSVNLQNLVALDGTFYDKANINTTWKGFNLPFDRMYLFGNITKDWDYQIAFQEALGSFNILDLWLNFRLNDKFNVRFGRMVTPFLLEYQTIWPGWDPNMMLSLLANIAGRRREGVMAWGRLFDNKIQYQQGVFNAAQGTFSDLSRNVDYIGALAFTPFKGSKGILDSLGCGIMVETGLHQYLLDQGNSTLFIIGGGEPNTNFAYFNSTGVPFFQYLPSMITDGLQTRVAPQLFWFGQFSFLAEYAYQQRHLENTATGVRGLEQVNGYYVNLSYFLTGERYNADGLSTYTAIAPNRPFIVSQHQYGIGAWELAAQYSQLWLNHGVVTDGFADPLLNATQISQLMAGVNWWMNKYVKFGFEWVNVQTNKAVPLSDVGNLGSGYNIYWTRLAMFF
ncbi:MAG TPA: porin [Gemmataceae bacterium]|jgi:phosphate-selective porin OprO/OprP